MTFQNIIFVFFHIYNNCHENSIDIPEDNFLIIFTCIRNIFPIESGDMLNLHWCKCLLFADKINISVHFFLKVMHQS